MASHSDEDPLERIISVNDCPIDQVTVYKDRAEVSRLLEINFPDGVYEIVIPGLSNSLDTDSGNKY